jgi:hypothetical protein
VVGLIRSSNSPIVFPVLFFARFINHKAETRADTNDIECGRGKVCPEWDGRVSTSSICSPLLQVATVALLFFRLMCMKAAALLYLQNGLTVTFFPQ